MNDSYLHILLGTMFSLYILGAVFGLICWRKPKLANWLPNILSMIAAATGGGTAITYLLTGSKPILISKLVGTVPLITLELRLDKLAAFFLLALSILVLCVSLYSNGYLAHYYNRRNVGVFNFLFNTFIVSMIGVITSGNIIIFLITWELMSLFSYFLVTYEAEETENRKAGILYLIMTHLATAFLVIAFGFYYRYTGSVEIGAVIQGVPIWVKNILFICFLIGFGTKAGIIPFHIWLPQAHPAAPSNVSALMSGIMIKIAIYGMLRFIFGALGTGIQWWGSAILILGAVSTVLGIAYALIEDNMKRLLAYCSIENIGLILISLGLSYLALNSGQPILGGLALFAALFHLLSHTIIKGALFLGAGAIQTATHTKKLEHLGGLLKKMPYTGMFILAASLAISALPPFSGFISEWLVLQTLFVSLLTASIGFKIVLILIVAAVAMAGAMAATSFVKFFGIGFLGLPRTEQAAEAREAPRTMLWGMGLLVLMTVVLGIFPGLLLKLLDKVVTDLVGISLARQVTGNLFFLYYPIAHGKLTLTRNVISPILLIIVATIILSLIWGSVRLFSRKIKERSYGTWDCGFTGLTPRMQYSATGFSKPFRIIFRVFYRTSRELVIEEGPTTYFHKSMTYQVGTESVFEKYLYQPITRASTKFANRFKLVVQTGSVHTYLIYIFVTILVLFLYFRLFN